MSDLVARARDFAIAAHGPQVRKYGPPVPYWTHLRNVADIVAGVPDATAEMLACAWLHDTVEDTIVTVDMIEREFGSTIRHGVLFLTKIEHPGLDKSGAAALYRDQLAHAPGWVQTVKVADIIDNSRSIMDVAPKRAPSYLEEKRADLAVLDRADAALLTRAKFLTGVIQS